MIFLEVFTHSVKQSFANDGNWRTCVYYRCSSCIIYANFLIVWVEHLSSSCLTRFSTYVVHLCIDFDIDIFYNRAIALLKGDLKVLLYSHFYFVLEFRLSLGGQIVACALFRIRWSIACRLNILWRWFVLSSRGFSIKTIFRYITCLLAIITRHWVSILIVVVGLRHKFCSYWSNTSRSTWVLKSLLRYLFFALAWIVYVRNTKPFVCPLRFILDLFYPGK